MRTPKESATLVAKAIKKINSLTKNVYGNEKKEVIHNVCKHYEVSEKHILNVGAFFFNEPKRNN